MERELSFSLFSWGEEVRWCRWLERVMPASLGGGFLGQGFTLHTVSVGGRVVCVPQMAGYALARFLPDPDGEGGGDLEAALGELDGFLLGGEGGAPRAHYGWARVWGGEGGEGVEGGFGRGADADYEGDVFLRGF